MQFNLKINCNIETVRNKENKMNKIFCIKSCLKPLCILTIVIVTILQSCNQNNDLVVKTENLTQFELTQPEILDVTKKGLSLQFDFRSCVDLAVDEYGLIWYDKEDSILVNNCVKSVMGKPTNREKIYFEINSCLPINKIIYIRAYIKVQGKVKYSQFVSVESQGCIAPVITKLLPEKILASKQIKIEGTNLIRTKNPSYLKISVNDYQINPDSVTEDGIYFTLPSKYFESNHFSYEMTLKIIMFGSEYPIEQKWTLTNPWRNISLSGNFPYNFSFYKGCATGYNNKGFVLFGNQNSKIYTYDADNNSWSNSDMPLSVDENSFCFNANNKIYVMTQGVMYSRDVNGSTWEQVTIYPSKYSNNKPFFHFVDNWLYIGFFQNYNSYGVREFRRYNIKENVWEKLASIPDAGGNVYSYFTFDFANKINFGTRRVNEPWEYSSNHRIWCYSISKNIWSWDFEAEYSDYPNLYDELELTSFNDGINVFIGFGENSDWPSYCADYAWNLNKKNGTWNMIPRCPSHIKLIAWFSVGRKIYLLGTDQDHIQKYFYELDTTKI
ncbi:hypothetical protein Palpr_2374 [Paludibacter propionicigenes WB4]|uniref:IPT/TIG domain-containing protein n=1 Tax=Paludibacter propionicigenes (strain DSM 17365 / JCM 13257 / WB4) TaxID=694427 RepID=E4T713_PALPW|nr:IPT/TIG domain-containing protein [Paludibacter propionicigenes]ADQ80507.1 hypothetical protein Palpr_2374 [Paludibacter propionicigenes WB4]